MKVLISENERVFAENEQSGLEAGLARVTAALEAQGLQVHLLGRSSGSLQSETASFEISKGALSLGRGRGTKYPSDEANFVVTMTGLRYNGSASMMVAEIERRLGDGATVAIVARLFENLAASGFEIVDGEALWTERLVAVSVLRSTIEVGYASAEHFAGEEGAFNGDDGSEEGGEYASDKFPLTARGAEEAFERAVELAEGFNY